LKGERREWGLSIEGCISLGSNRGGIPGFYDTHGQSVHYKTTLVMGWFVQCGNFANYFPDGNSD
jgi:hypothetical protein